MGKAERANYTAENEAIEMKAVYHQFVAYLFTFYNQTLPDGNIMHLDHLNALNFEFDPPSKGPEIPLMKWNNTKVTVNSTSYGVTIRNAVVPQGSMVFRFALHYFRGSCSIAVSGPNQRDLFLDAGYANAHAVVWRERNRRLNWLSLGIVTIFAFALLLLLRVVLRPAAMSDIAATVVKSCVGADLNRSPIEVSPDEEKWVSRFDSLVSDDQFGAYRTDSSFNQSFHPAERIVLDFDDTLYDTYDGKEH